MLIDRRSKPWIITASAIFIVATIACVPYHLHSPIGGPSGSSAIGLTYGIVGTLMILLAFALTPRKKLRTMRIGRANLWMQAHVWFGLLSFPIICYHAGFRTNLWGGSLTTALMAVFIVVEITGIFGLIMQQVIPSKMLREVPYETIYEQIEHVVEMLRNEAREKIAVLTEKKVEGEYNHDAVSPGTAPAVATATPGCAELEAFHQQLLLPFLSDNPAKNPLYDDASAMRVFDRLRDSLPSECHETANDLQSIADERRQLIHQKRLHTYLHAWLLVHVPLSASMLAMMIVHIIVALRYTW